MPRRILHWIRGTDPFPSKRKSDTRCDTARKRSGIRRWPPVSVFVRQRTGYSWATITVYIGHVGREFRSRALRWRDDR